MLNINKDEVKLILGRDYEDVKEFFYNVITFDCSYKVLVTRRSYVLFKIFESIILSELEENPPSIYRGMILNTHSLHLLPKEGNAKVLIIDDILVNGRTFSKVIDEIIKISPKLDLSIWCLRGNSDAQFLYLIKDKIQRVSYVASYEWKRFSDKLTDVIISSNIGYISWVNSYRLLGLDRENILKCSKKNNFIFIEEEVSVNNPEVWANRKIEKIRRVFSTIIWTKHLIPHEIESKYKISSCVRLYKKENDDSFVVIPYVFLPSMASSSCYSYCVNLLNSLGLQVDYFFVENEGDQTLFLTLFYKWTIKTVSDWLIYKFIKLFPDLRESQIQSYFVCNESYYLKKNENDFSFSVPKFDVLSFGKNNVLIDPEIKHCKKHLQEYCNSQSSFSVSFDNYLAFMRNEDEKRAREGEQRRYKGFRLEDLTDIIEKDIYEATDIFSIIINYWDNGKIAYTVDTWTVDNHQYIGGLIRHGEQAFRSLYAANKDIYELFFVFFLKQRPARKEHFISFAKYCDNRFNGVFKGKRFLNFAVELDEYNFFSDFMSITPDSIDAESKISNPESVVDDYILTMT